MNRSALFYNVETNHLKWKDKPLEIFERKEKWVWTQKQMQLLKDNTGANVATLTASFLLANIRSLLLLVVLILPVAKDICNKLLGESAVQR